MRVGDYVITDVPENTKAVRFMDPGKWTFKRKILVTIEDEGETLFLSFAGADNEELPNIVEFRKAKRVLFPNAKWVRFMRADPETGEMQEFKYRI